MENISELQNAEKVYFGIKESMKIFFKENIETENLEKNFKNKFREEISDFVLKYKPTPKNLNLKESILYELGFEKLKSRLVSYFKELEKEENDKHKNQRQKD